LEEVCSEWLEKTDAGLKAKIALEALRELEDYERSINFGGHP